MSEELSQVLHNLMHYISSLSLVALGAYLIVNKYTTAGNWTLAVGLIMVLMGGWKKSKSTSREC